MAHQNQEIATNPTANGGAAIVLLLLMIGLGTTIVCQIGCYSAPCSDVGSSPAKLLQEHPVVALCIVEQYDILDTLGKVPEWAPSSNYRLEQARMTVIEAFKGTDIGSIVYTFTIHSHNDSEPLYRYEKVSDTVLIYGRSLVGLSPLQFISGTIRASYPTIVDEVLKGEYELHRWTTFARDSTLLERARRSVKIMDAIDRFKADEKSVVMGEPEDGFYTKTVLRIGSICLADSTRPGDLILSSEEYMSILRELSAK